MDQKDTESDKIYTSTIINETEEFTQNTSFLKDMNKSFEIIKEKLSEYFEEKSKVQAEDLQPSLESQTDANSDADPVSARSFQRPSHLFARIFKNNRDRERKSRRKQPQQSRFKTASSSQLDKLLGLKQVEKNARFKLPKVSSKSFEIAEKFTPAFLPPKLNEMSVLEGVAMKVFQKPKPFGFSTKRQYPPFIVLDQTICTDSRNKPEKSQSRSETEIVRQRTFSNESISSIDEENESMASILSNFYSGEDQEDNYNTQLKLDQNNFLQDLIINSSTSSLNLSFESSTSTPSLHETQSDQSFGNFESVNHDFLSQSEHSLAIDQNFKNMSEFSLETPYDDDNVVLIQESSRLKSNPNPNSTKKDNFKNPIDSEDESLILYQSESFFNYQSPQLNNNSSCSTKYTNTGSSNTVNDFNNSSIMNNDDQDQDLVEDDEVLIVQHEVDSLLNFLIDKIITVEDPEQIDDLILGKEPKILAGGDEQTDEPVNLQKHLNVVQPVDEKVESASNNDTEIIGEIPQDIQSEKVLNSSLAETELNYENPTVKENLNESNWIESGDHAESYVSSDILAQDTTCNMAKNDMIANPVENSNMKQVDDSSDSDCIENETVVEVKVENSNEEAGENENDLQVDPPVSNLSNVEFSPVSPTSSIEEYQSDRNFEKSLKEYKSQQCFGTLAQVSESHSDKMDGPTATTTESLENIRIQNDLLIAQIIQEDQDHGDSSTSDQVRVDSDVEESSLDEENSDQANSYTTTSTSESDAEGKLSTPVCFSELSKRLENIVENSYDENEKKYPEYSDVSLEEFDSRVEPFSDSDLDPNISVSDLAGYQETDEDDSGDGADGEEESSEHDEENVENSNSETSLESEVEHESTDGIIKVAENSLENEQENPESSIGNSVENIPDFKESKNDDREHSDSDMKSDNLVVQDSILDQLNNEAEEHEVLAKIPKNIDQVPPNIENDFENSGSGQLEVIPAYENEEKVNPSEEYCQISELEDSNEGLSTVQNEVDQNSCSYPVVQVVKSYVENMISEISAKQKLDLDLIETRDFSLDSIQSQDNPEFQVGIKISENEVSFENTLPEKVSEKLNQEKTLEEHSDSDPISVEISSNLCKVPILDQIKSQDFESSTNQNEVDETNSSADGPAEETDQSLENFETGNIDNSSVNEMGQSSQDKNAKEIIDETVDQLSEDRIKLTEEPEVKNEQNLQNFQGVQKICTELKHQEFKTESAEDIEKYFDHFIESSEKFQKIDSTPNLGNVEHLENKCLEDGQVSIEDQSIVEKDFQVDNRKTISDLVENTEQVRMVFELGHVVQEIGQIIPEKEVQNETPSMIQKTEDEDLEDKIEETHISIKTEGKESLEQGDLNVDEAIKGLDESEHGNQHEAKIDTTACSQNRTTLESKLKIKRKASSSTNEQFKLGPSRSKVVKRRSKSLDESVKDTLKAIQRNKPKRFRMNKHLGRWWKGAGMQFLFGINTEEIDDQDDFYRPMTMAYNANANANVNFNLESPQPNQEIDKNQNQVSDFSMQNQKEKAESESKDDKDQEAQKSKQTPDFDFDKVTSASSFVTLSEDPCGSIQIKPQMKRMKTFKNISKKLKYDDPTSEDENSQVFDFDFDKDEESLALKASDVNLETPRGLSYKFDVKEQDKKLSKLLKNEWGDESTVTVHMARVKESKVRQFMKSFIRWIRNLFYQLRRITTCRRRPKNSKKLDSRRSTSS